MADQTPLVAERLANDPRVAEAKKLLMEAVADHQRAVSNPRPPLDERKESYEQMLERAKNVRGGALWYPYLGSGIGNGSLVELADGSVKYDFICGIGVHYWGHSTPELVEALFDAAMGDTVMQGNLQQNVDSLEFMELLVEASHLDHCFLTTTGVMAVENALKIAFQKNQPANRVLAFSKCFAGRTLAAAAITDKAFYRQGLPTAVSVDYVPFFDPNDPDGSTERTLQKLDEYLHRYPGQHAAMIMELIQGEGTGFVYGTTAYYEKIMQRLKEHNIAVIVDEVQSFGRTPELFAYQHFGLEPYVDIVTVGKLSQVCATIYRKDYAPKPGLLSQTFTGSTSALRAGTMIIRNLLEGGYLGPSGKIATIHDYCEQNLNSIAKRHPGLVRGPYGIGTMVAFTPLDGTAETVKKLTFRLFDKGVICFGAGSEPYRVRFLLPIGAITMEEIDAVLAIVEETLLELQTEVPCI